VKRRPTISGALAVIALVLAAGGTAYASSYIITSAHQIKPSVLAQLRGKRGPRGYTGLRGKAGVTDTTGGTTNSAPPAQGAAGNTGPAGTTGAPGASGVNSPLVVTAAGTSTGPDSGDCGNSWATDTYNRTWVIEPQADGSYTIYEQVKGTFVTLAGVSEPNPASCTGTSLQTGGVTGTFYGVETWAVPAPGANESADFDPFAACTAACDPTTTGTTSSNDQGNLAFESLFFPTAAYAGVTNYDFVYNTAANGSWVDSNTSSNNAGNITG
jgi:hypothetical protein